MRAIKTVLVLGLVLLGSQASAATPTDRHFLVEGFLKTDGVALDGSYELTFALYSAEGSATALWSETLSLDVNNGFFQAPLGLDAANPLEDWLFRDNPHAWLGVTLGTQAEFPRLPVETVPYAFRAVTSDEVDGFHAGATPAAAQLLALDSDGKFPLEAIRACTTAGEIIKSDGTGWVCGEDSGTEYFAGVGLSLDVAAATFSVDLTELANELAAWDQDASDDLTTATDFGGDVTGTWEMLTLGPGVVTAANLGEVCGPGQLLKYNTGGSWSCADDLDTTYSAPMGGGLQLGAANELELVDCAPGQVLKYVDALGGIWSCAADENTQNSYDGSDFATSGQACLGSDKVTGIDATGAVTCAADIDSDTTYDGTDFATSGQACLGSDKVTGVDANGAVTCAADNDTTYDGTDFATSAQACLGSDKVTGIDANGAVTCAADIDTDNDTTYDGTDFAISGQACGGSNKVSGIGLNGLLICDADVDSTYDGSDFAISGQTCLGTDKVVGVGPLGNLVCGADVDTDSDTTYDGSDFAISNQACLGTDKMTGIDATGAVVCAPDVDTDTDTDTLGGLACGANQIAKRVGGVWTCANDSNGFCYTRWGEWGCAAGFEEVMRGRPGGHEDFHSGGVHHGNVECVDSSAAVMSSWAGGYANRLMRGDAQGDGMTKVRSRCSICCTGGCYTALGTNACAAGYSAAYSGRTGGVEAYATGQIYSKSMCVDSTATAHYTWASGYNTRLMRHRDIANGSGDNGMDQINNICAECCKQ